MPSVYNDSFTTSLSIWIPFISTACLTAVVRTSYIEEMWWRWGYPWFVPDFSRKTFSFSPLSIILAVHTKLLQTKSFLTLCVPVDCSCQGPLSIGFSRQEHWSRLLCPLPGDLPDAGIELTSLMSPRLAGRFFSTSAIWKSHIGCGIVINSFYNFWDMSLLYPFL